MQALGRTSSIQERHRSFMLHMESFGVTNDAPHDGRELIATASSLQSSRAAAVVCPKLVTLPAPRDCCAVSGISIRSLVQRKQVSSVPSPWRRELTPPLAPPTATTPHSTSNARSSNSRFRPVSSFSAPIVQLLHKVYCLAAIGAYRSPS